MVNKNRSFFQARGKRIFVPLVMLACAHFLSGCASVIYKDAATTYIAATRDLSKQLDDVSTRLVKADDNFRLSKIVADRACPIADKRLFVRDGSDVLFSPFLKRTPDLMQSSTCQPLLACESAAGRPAYCANACYTASESNCIVQLEQNFAILVKKISAKEVDAESVESRQLAEDADRLAAQLHRVEYGRPGKIANMLAADSLRILSEYMDLLEKATRQNKSDLTADAKKLSDRMIKVTDGYAKFTNEKLSSDDQKTRTDIQNYLGALGKLAGDIRVMTDNAKDAEKIKAFVNKNAIDVAALIAAIEPVIEGDDLLGITVNNAAAFRVRHQLQERFQKEQDAYARLMIFNDVAKYPYTSADASSSALKAVFKKVAESHDTLVTLVNNPTDEQIMKKRQEELQQIRTLVEDVAGVLALIK